MSNIDARLIVRRTPPRPGRRHVDVYDVEVGGQLVVTNSTDPACDLARALQAIGMTGAVKVYGPNGQHRYTVDIEKAAQLHAYDDVRDGPRFRNVGESTGSASCSAESEAA